MKKDTNELEPVTRKIYFRWAGWFSLVNFVIVLGLISRYLKFANDIEGPLQGFYVVAALGGHAMSLALVVFLAVLLPLILLIPRKYIVTSAGILAASLGIVALLIDFGVYSQYRFHINGMVVDLVVNGGSEIFDFSWVTYAMGTMGIIAVFILQIIVAKAAWHLANKEFRLRLKGLLILVAFILLIASNVIHAWSDAAYYRPITTITRHIPLYKPVTAKRFMEQHGFVDLNENWKLNKLSAKKSRNNSVNYPVSPLQYDSSEKQMNIVYLVVDSWRFDMLNEAITPNTFSFLNDKHAMKFSNHTSGGNGTRTGLFSMFYGIFGSYWTCMETEQIGSAFIDRLVEQNYQMGVFASAKLTTPAFNQTVFSSVENLRLNSDGNNAWERDLDIVADWNIWFDNRDKSRPFFSFLFFDSAHSYTFPPDYGTHFKPMLERVDYHKFNNEYDPLPMINRYKNSLHFIDSLIGKVLDKIARNADLSNTLIVITSDHGQEFNENKKNYWGHASNFTDYQIKVPLIIYWPGKAGSDYVHLTNHVDLTPTLMTEVLGCTNPLTDFSNGRSLFDTNERQWVFSGGGLSAQAIIERDRITEMFSTGGYEIFDTDYSVIKGANLNPKIVKETIMENKRFYR